MGFAEQEIDSRQPQGVSREIEVETESGLLVRTAHGHFSQRDAEAALRAIVRGPEQAALRRGDEVIHQPPLGRQVHARRLSAHEAVQRLPELRRAQLGPRLACGRRDRKSTRLNSSHVAISYAVFCLKKKTKNRSVPQNAQT